MIACEDWRAARPVHVAPLIEAEARRYQHDLGWDVSGPWRAIEPARSAGYLPGLLCRDRDDRIVGWTCFLVQQGTLQVAMFAAESPAVTAVLVDRIVDSPDASRAGTWAVNVRDSAPGLGDALAGHGFDVVPYRYLTRSLADWSAEPVADVEGVRPWSDRDGAAFTRLCESAYRDEAGIRAFAPQGSSAEWAAYVTGLVAGACGDLLPEASFVVSDPRTGTLRAAILSTRLSQDTGHIAQLIVHPLTRSFGLGRALVGDALRAMATRGLRQATLFVSRENGPAQRIYERGGFGEVASFVVALNRQPRRFSSVAPEIAGASTRR